MALRRTRRGASQSCGPAPMSSLPPLACLQVVRCLHRRAELVDRERAPRCKYLSVHTLDQPRGSATNPEGCPPRRVVQAGLILRLYPTKCGYGRFSTRIPCALEDLYGLADFGLNRAGLESQ